MLTPFLFILYLNELVHVCNDARRGLFINESMSIVHLLLHADDVGMVNCTIDQLQRQLNIMSEMLQDLRILERFAESL